jgi:hypothetical protein
MFVRMNEIKANGGWGNVEGFKGNITHADAITNRIINNFSMADMFVHEENSGSLDAHCMKHARQAPDCI